MAFVHQQTGKAPAKLALDDLDAARITAFLAHLENERGNSVRTRNARLTAIPSFFHYAALRAPECAELIARVLSIPEKRFDTTLINYLTEPEIDALLKSPDRSIWTKRIRSSGRGDGRRFCPRTDGLSSPPRRPPRHLATLTAHLCSFDDGRDWIMRGRASVPAAGIFGASNNAAFRRRQFVDRGGFDLALGPATPAFGAEDLDVFLALILDGHRILYEPRAVVRHEHRRDFPGLYWQVFTYSAGFTALLTKWALKDAKVARDLARRVPRLLPSALLRSHRSGPDAHLTYPRQLRWLERVGYLYGPIAYARSRLRGGRTSAGPESVARAAGLRMTFVGRR